MSDLEPSWKPVSWVREQTTSGKRRASSLDKPLPKLPGNPQKGPSFAQAVRLTLTWGTGCCGALAPRRTGSLRRHKAARSTPSPEWYNGSAPREVVSRGTQPTPSDTLKPEIVVETASSAVLPVHDPRYYSAESSSPSLGRSRRYDLSRNADSADLPGDLQARRANTRSLRSFLDTTSPSTVHSHVGNSSEHSGSPPGFSPSLLNVELVTPRRIRDPDSRPEDSTGTVDTYASHYSDRSPVPSRPVMATTKPVPVPGLAVTQRGIIKNPLVARRTISDSATMTADLHPANLQAGSPPQRVPSSPGGWRKSSRRRGSLPHLSLLRQELKKDLSPPDSPAPAFSPSVKTVVHDEPGQMTPMAEWGRLSPPIFRRPVEGYFEIPGMVNVDDPPDHLQTSWLCPLHPKHHYGQRSYCPIHGRRATRESSGSYARTSDNSGGSDSSDDDAEVPAQGKSARPSSPGGVAYWNHTRFEDHEQRRPPLGHKPRSSPARASGIERRDRPSPAAGPTPAHRLVLRGLEQRPGGREALMQGQRGRRREPSDRGDVGTSQRRAENRSDASKKPYG